MSRDRMRLRLTTGMAATPLHHHRSLVHVSERRRLRGVVAIPVVGLSLMTSGSFCICDRVVIVATHEDRPGDACELVGQCCCQEVVMRHTF